MSEMKEKTLFIGIDPGLDGCLAILRDDGKFNLVPFDKDAYVTALSSVRKALDAHMEDRVVCALEHVGGIPGQSAPAAFNFGANFGWITGVLECLGIPYELVRPQKWKREFSCTSDKNTSIEVAKRLFPGEKFLRTEKCKKPHDGMCESILLAEYAKRRMA